MKSLIWSLGVLLATSPISGAEKSKANTLTAKEIADGWVLLFDGKTSFGWKTTGNVKVKAGTLVLGNGMASRAATTTFFSDFELKFEFHQKGVFNTRASGELGLFGGETLRLSAFLDDWIQATVRFSGGQFSAQYSYKGSTEYTQKAKRKEGLPFPLTFIIPAKVNIAFRNIKLKPLGLKPIFNGKDLTAWKPFKGKRYKSRFAISKKGELTIKNGPGDLQTTGQWADFVLQIECKTNGNYLNSGVFFRCQPGKYQQGYEAQIHNKFLPAPGREYKLQVFDPKTHKVAATKKVKYLAADYGTGAIYNRQPARLQMAKDKEWFAMTVIARGRHIAVWVNGVQVTDWTDNRPLSDNARNGCRLEKGPISLQGHDPTTDLSFRNIRIAELPRGKDGKK
jgi:hypothetical protein